MLYWQTSPRRPACVFGNKYNWESWLSSHYLAIFLVADMPSWLRSDWVKSVLCVPMGATAGKFTPWALVNAVNQGFSQRAVCSRICMTPWVWSLVKVPSETKPVGASFLSLSGWMYRWSVDWGILHPAWQGRGYKHGFLYEDSLLLLGKWPYSAHEVSRQNSNWVFNARF